MVREISFPGHSNGYPASILDVVRLCEKTDTVVAQCLGYDQHCPLVQPHAHQIPAAAVDLAAIWLVGPGCSTVVGNLFKRTGIQFIQDICIIPAEAVDVRHIRLFKQLVDISYILLASLICAFANLTLYLCIFEFYIKKSA